MNISEKEVRLSYKGIELEMKDIKTGKLKIKPFEDVKKKYGF